MYVPSKLNQQKKTLKKKLFWASWRSLTKRAGFGSRAGSGSVSQRYWFENSDPYQNGTDPEHCRGQFPFYSFWCKRHQTVGKDEESRQYCWRIKFLGGGADLRLTNEKADSLKPYSIYSKILQFKFFPFAGNGEPSGTRCPKSSSYHPLLWRLTPLRIIEFSICTSFRI